MILSTRESVFQLFFSNTWIRRDGFFPDCECIETFHNRSDLGFNPLLKIRSEDPSQDSWTFFSIRRASFIAPSPCEAFRVKASEWRSESADAFIRTQCESHEAKGKPLGCSPRSPLQITARYQNPIMKELLVSKSGMTHEITCKCASLVFPLPLVNVRKRENIFIPTTEDLNAFNFRPAESVRDESGGRNGGD